MDTHTNQRVALKIMNKRPNSSRQAEQINREIVAMQRATHPNALRLLHTDLHLDYPCGTGTRQCVLLVVELATGGEVRE